MADNAPRYERLISSRFRFDGFGSLWMGPDHVLLVTSRLSVENYRRWFFRDIQVLIARRSSMRLVLNLVYCILGALFGLGAAGIVALAANENSAQDVAVLYAMAGIVGFVALMCFGLAIVNTLLGPTCTVFVQTPHSIEKLSVPKRLATFERLVARLRSHVESSQGQPGAPGMHSVAVALDQQS
jgi:hypothetical protein